MILRRHLLAGVCAAAVLTGCAGTTLTPQTVVTEAQTLITGLQGVFSNTAVTAAITAVVGGSAALSKIQSDLTLAQGAAATLSTGLGTTAGASTAQVIDTYINAVLDTAATPPIVGLIPPPYNLALTAAAVVVPEIEAFVNQYLPASMVTVSASREELDRRQSVRAALMRAAPSMTLELALQTLARYSRH